MIVLNQVTNNLIQIGVNTLVYPKAKTQSDLEQEVCAKIVNNKFACIWVICQRNINEVVGLCALWALIQDGIEDVSVQLVKGGVISQEDQVICESCIICIMAETTKLINVLIHRQVNTLRPFNCSTTAPDKHNNKDSGSH